MMFYLVCAAVFFVDNVSDGSNKILGSESDYSDGDDGSNVDDDEEEGDDEDDDAYDMNISNLLVS